MLDINKTFHVFKYLDVDLEKLHKELNSIDFLKFEQKEGRNIFHYWIEDKSTRGVFVHHKVTHVDVYTSFLANETDYSLLNRIALELKKLTGRHIENEWGTIVDIPYNDSFRWQVIDDDFFQFKHIINGNGLFNIPGVYRQVFMGENTFKQLRGLDDFELKNKVFEIIQKVNFKHKGFKNSPYYKITFNDKEFGNDTTLIANEDNLVISLFDYVTFSDNGKLIFITNKILKEIKPEKWELLDEYNIAACKLNNKEWQKLLSKAKKRNLYNKLQKQGENGKKTD